ncbi:low temperature requirement protein A [Homoserinibacter sp. GY 40078]|uniref:low temperature requirement protein A n=1 Tax=Homoserinibacter sp. GY 40078 TaxID=2603275 RepID=UPI0011C9200F|nr:low temperature requirement protein A [Homoserinibacter sp. GY 40078]TXK17804.1 low temperature requirement protein A [Homoserinibacter sp. GY 40078]
MPTLQHGLRRAIGRDPSEPHRTATPLELLYDLTFVIAFGATSTQLAHAIAFGHTVDGLLAFAFTTFAVSWAWINFSWWASAFDTDDWFVRICTLVQMVGVILLALGIPEVFQSVEHGDFHNEVMVTGYVIMRLGLLPLWIRVAVQDAARRSAATVYAVTLVTAQLGWIVVAVSNLSIGWTLLATVPLYVVETAGPVIAERRFGGTPWHPHHIAERYGLLVIITLGEVVLGTATTIGAVVQKTGWSIDAGLVAVAGIALAFALWWVYFSMPSGYVLERFRDLGFVWGYGQIVLLGTLVATGAGLEVAALATQGETPLPPVAAAAAVVIPVAALLLTLFALYSILLSTVDPFHVMLFAAAIVILGAGVLAAWAGASIWAWLGIVVLAPVLVVVGYETIGHRHQAQQLERLTG